MSANHTKSRREWLALLGIGTAGGLAGCIGDDDGDPAGDDDSAGDDDEPVDPGEIEVSGDWVSAAGTDAETVYPTALVDTHSANRVGLCLDGAYAVTHEDEIFPLWMDVTDTGDGQVFVCELRDNLEWGAGYGQMTAEDWVYHIEEVHQHEDNWAGSLDQADWAGINVEQNSELEFQIELPGVNPDFPFEPALWGEFCLPKELYEEYRPDGEALEQSDEINEMTYTGNLGPYTFERWDRDAEFVAVRNDDYYMHDADDIPEDWQGAPYFESYTYRVIEEESTRLQALQQGEATTAGIPAPRYDDFSGEPDIDVYEIPQPHLSILAYNQRANGWDELQTREVRQALSMAINKETIAEEIQRGLAEIAYTHQPEWSEWYDASQVLELGTGDGYDKDEARDMLEQYTSDDYGYDDDELVGPDGQVELHLVYSEASDTTEMEAEFIAQELGDIGIEVSLDSMSFSRMQQQVLMNEYTGEGEPPEWASAFNGGPRDETESAEQWDLNYGIAFNTYPRTPAAIDVFWYEQGSTNYYGYTPDEDMQAKFDEFQTEPDQDAREEMFAEILGILSEDQPVNFVTMSDDIVGFQNDVRGPREVFGGTWDSNTFYFTNGN